MIVGCYTLDLYCDGDPACRRRDCNYRGAPPLQTTGETRAECTAQAKQRGWKINHRTNIALCPDCAKAGK